jgi:hypothetical protein
VEMHPSYNRNNLLQKYISKSKKWEDDVRSVAVNDYMYPDTGFLNRR